MHLKKKTYFFINKIFIKRFYEKIVSIQLRHHLVQFLINVYSLIRRKFK